MESQQQLAFPPQRRIWTVSELLAGLKSLLDRDFFDVWIEGEISNFHRSAARHCYFTLKDGQGQMRAALFAGQARYLRFQPQDGLQVLARGRLGLYEARGELQLYVERLEPRGWGALQAAFEALKGLLDAEGLFAADRKRRLPALPRCIALVTSPRGAAVADMIRVLHRRLPSVRIVLVPVAVQGVEAPGEIAAALRMLAALDAGSPHRPDLLIVGRGGGSLEDLWAFNTEEVARALAASPIPTISAVGHETDVTIADFVADLRAPTPSAAAELAVPAHAELWRGWNERHRHLEQAIRYRLLQRRERVLHLARHRGFEAMRHRLGQRQQAADELGHRLRARLAQRLRAAERRLGELAAAIRARDPRGRLAAAQGRLELRRSHLGAAWAGALARRRHRLDALAGLLAERNPLRLLDRGYTLVYHADGRLARAAAEFQPGDALQVRFAHDVLAAEARRPPAGGESG